MVYAITNFVLKVSSCFYTVVFFVYKYPYIIPLAVHPQDTETQAHFSLVSLWQDGSFVFALVAENWSALIMSFLPPPPYTFLEQPQFCKSKENQVFVFVCLLVYLFIYLFVFWSREVL